MPIHESMKVVYIHIPKTGGTSIEEALGMKTTDGQFWGRRHDVDASKQHYSHTEMLNVRSDILDWFTFVSIRNPWDRVLSGWAHHPKWKNEVGSFDNFISLMKENVFELGNLYWLDGYVTPQTHFIPKIRDFHVLRFESLQKDFAEMCKNYSEFSGIDNQLPILEGRQVATGVGKNYRDYYSNNQKILIEKLFEEEIELFKYKFGEK